MCARTGSASLAIHADQSQFRDRRSQKDFSAAVDAYKKNYAVKPNIQSARKLASIYSLNNQNVQAIQFLNDVMEQHGDKAEPLRLKLAELQLKSQPDKALEQYKTILSKEPNNALALNNIAWLYLNSTFYIIRAVSN